MKRLGATLRILNGFEITIAERVIKPNCKIITDDFFTNVFFHNSAKHLKLKIKLVVLT